MPFLHVPRGVVVHHSGYASSILESPTAHQWKGQYSRNWFPFHLWNRGCQTFWIICVNGSAFFILFSFPLSSLSTVLPHQCLLSWVHIVCDFWWLRDPPRWASARWQSSIPAPEMGIQVASILCHHRQVVREHLSSGSYVEQCENFLGMCTKEQNCCSRDADSHVDSPLTIVLQIPASVYTPIDSVWELLDPQNLLKLSIVKDIGIRVTPS